MAVQAFSYRIKMLVKTTNTFAIVATVWAAWHGRQADDGVLGIMEVCNLLKIHLMKLCCYCNINK